VELLGFGEIEMVQELLAHREAIVASVLQDSSSLLQTSKKETACQDNLLQKKWQH